MAGVSTRPSRIDAARIAHRLVPPPAEPED
jgi:hypothetical protein